MTNHDVTDENLYKTYLRAYANNPFNLHRDFNTVNLAASKLEAAMAIGVRGARHNGQILSMAKLISEINWLLENKAV